ncbi:MAG: hypothetical protein ACI379_04495 [Nocardioides sp.]|uniref:hypothetical protein n=1 Tax=Nocardioides sp. TaxID=35761 RepID=UPI003F100884
MDWLATVRAVHERITVGDAPSLKALSEDANTLVDQLIEVEELITLARSSPHWVGLGSRFFSTRSWGALVLTQVARQRLNSYSLILGYVSASLEKADTYISELLPKAEAHEEKIQQQAATEADPDAILHLQGLAFAAAAKICEANLNEAYTTARGVLTPESFSDEERAWLEDGKVESMQHLLDGPNRQGPAIPDIFGGGLSTADWIPQGLAHDPGTGYTYQTSYTKDGRALLSIIDPETGKQITSVELGGNPPPDHAGGVSVHDGTVWVSSSTKPPTVIPYSLAELQNAGPYTTVPPKADPTVVGGGAYHTVVGNTMYAGTFEEHGPGQMFTYQWDGSGWVKSGGPFTTPQQTQGIAVQGDQIVFSTSYGRGNEGDLQTYSLSDVLGTDGDGGLPDPSHQVDLPTMAEGIALGPDGLLTTFESGAQHYSTNPKGEDLWASLNMTITPYSALGLSGADGQLEVDPPSLHEAVKLLHQAEDRLSGVRDTVNAFHVGGWALGTVSGASPLRTAVNDHADVSADWVRSARRSTEASAEATKSAADFMESAEDVVRDAFAKGSDLLGTLKDRLS